MAHSARLIVLCIVATLLIMSVTAAPAKKKPYHFPWRSRDFRKRNASNTTTYSVTVSVTKPLHRRRTFPTNTTSMSMTQTTTQSSTQTYSLTLSKSRTIKVNFTNATTAAPNVTNATTTAPNTTTVAPNTTAPNATNATTRAPNTTTVAPNTTAPVNTTAPNATAAPNATNATSAPNGTNAPPFTFPATPVPTPLPPGQTAPPPTPTAQPPQITMTVGGDASSFNTTVFEANAAAVVGLPSENVRTYSFTPGSVKVVWGFVSSGNVALSNDAIAAASNSFVNNVANSNFVKTYTIVAAPTVQTFTPAPFATPFNWRQIEASPAVTIPTLLLAAVIAIASFLH